MTTDTSTKPLRELIERGTELSATVVADVRAGRLDCLEDTLDQREVCLRELQCQLHALDSPLPDALEEGLRALRAADRSLTEWMQQEKQDVVRALSSLRGQRVDPYSEAISGPVALDQRR